MIPIRRTQATQNNHNPIVRNTMTKKIKIPPDLDHFLHEVEELFGPNMLKKIQIRKSVSAKYRREKKNKKHK